MQDHDVELRLRSDDPVRLAGQKADALCDSLATREVLCRFDKPGARVDRRGARLYFVSPRNRTRNDSRATPKIEHRGMRIERQRIEVVADGLPEQHMLAAGF